jgi:hypothetical protein
MVDCKSISTVVLCSNNTSNTALADGMGKGLVMGRVPYPVGTGVVLNNPTSENF